MKNIYIAADMLMTRPVTQMYHVKWVNDFFYRPIKAATDANIEVFNPDAVGFDRRKFFKLSNIHINELDTHSWFDVSLINESSIAYLKSFIEGSILICYEISKQTRKILDDIGVDYIDIWLHPIRYMDDNFFAFRSNNADVNRIIEKYKIEDSYFYLYADRMRINSYRGWNKHNLDNDLYQNSALFIGQTMTDKAVCRKGKMLNLLDFKEEFENLCRSYTHVYYSPHPMLKEDGKAIEDYINSLDNASVIKHEAYKLLTTNAIKKVVSISSSVVFESKFFGKDFEYLYRPVVDCDNEKNAESYISVYEGFESPKFWSDILSPITGTKCNTYSVRFLDRSSKIRDMLSLYYNSHTFDRLDNLYKTSNKQSTSKDKNKNKITTPFLPNHIHMSHFENLVRDVDVVSFDIFDTLIERPFSSPSTIFDLIQSDISKIAKHDISNFRDMRLKAKNNVDVEKYKEEVSLELRYKQICKDLNLNCDYRSLMEIELNEEYRLCSTKLIGKALYDKAINMGKKVILITDIFFDTKFLKKLLEKTGYDSNVEIYNSNDYGYLKHSGNLYPFVISSLGIPSSKILHVGDNIISDIKMANEKGLKTFHVDTSINILKSISPIIDATKFENKKFESISHGVIASKLSHYPMITTHHGFCGGCPEKFGYSVASHMFLGMAKWILENAIENKYERIYFLARDGEIIKRVYDVLAKYNNDAPKSVYLLASRRSVRVASLISEQSISDELSLALSDISKNQAPSTIREFIKSRFGLDTSSDEFAQYSNILDTRAEIGNKAKIKEVFKSKLIVDGIINNSRKERDSLLDYYSQNFLCPNSKDKVAFVDIGHKGSLQRGICDLLHIEQSDGYYFSTYEAIDDVLGGTKHRSFGYLRDRFPLNNREDKYIKYALIFETLFLNNQYSFIRFNTDHQPEYLEFKEDQRRIYFSDRLHKGIESYSEDICKVISGRMDFISMTPDESIAPFIRFLENPNLRDVKVFEGICLENYFSGRKVRYIVPPKGKVSKEGIWRQGTLLRYQNENPNTPKSKSSITISKNNKSNLIINALKYILRDKYLPLKRKYRKYVS